MKLISVNIEKDRHLERVIPFLKKEHPDVICLQEVFESDCVDIARSFSMHAEYVPITIVPRHTPRDNRTEESMGIAILSVAPLTNVQRSFYRGNAGRVESLDMSTKERHLETMKGCLLSADVPAGNTIIPIATTHFTWSADGKMTEPQKEDAEKLLQILSRMPGVVLCGDFNIPRGINALYEKFAARYKDAIPASYTSSIDVNIHRAGTIPGERAKLERYMVDYLFLSSGYVADNVRLVCGVSDHCAIVADIGTVKDS